MKEWWEYKTVSLILDVNGQKLFLGSIHDTMLLATANPNGIQAVLDVSTELDYPWNKDILYQRIPFSDGSHVSAKDFHRCMKFLTECWNKGMTIQVNCQAGISRSSSIVCSFLHHSGLATSQCGLVPGNMDKIIEYVAKRRPHIQPHVNVISSCKYHLKMWPHDGSYGESVVVLRHSKLQEKILAAHKDETCPVRIALLAQKDSSMVECSCGLGL